MGTPEDLVEEILAAVHKIFRGVDLRSRLLARCEGLTGSQVGVLIELNRCGQLRAFELARLASLSHETVAEILDRLEKGALVSKEPDVIGRRRDLIQITEKGQCRIMTAPPVLQERFAAELRKLRDWEQTLLLCSLQRIGAMVEAGETDKVHH
jgi:DNA-binding MarR family transcriptional regulator